MTDPKTFPLAGLEWRIEPLQIDAQFEVECLLARVVGPTVASIAPVLIRDLIVPVLNVVGDLVGEDDAFDLARLGELDTADPRLQVGFRTVLNSLGRLTEEAVVEGINTLARLLNHDDLQRIFFLCILDGKTMVRDPSGERGPSAMSKVNSFKLVSDMLRHDYQAKWELLTQALLVTYGVPGEDASEAD